MNNDEKPTLKDTYDAVKRINDTSNKRNISAPVVKAYLNIYRLLYERVADETVVPKLTDQELIAEWISNRNWLMIPPKGCISRKQALNSPYPNIWVYLAEGLESMACGLHWAQATSVDNFLSLLDSLNYKYRERLRQVFESLRRNYKIVTQIKVHEKGLAPAAPANFENVKKWNLNEFNSTCADELLQSVEEIREEGQQLREFGKVEWAVPTIQVEYRDMKGNDYETLLEVIFDYVKIMKVCHETLTQLQLRKIRRSLEKDFDYDMIKKEYERLKFLLKINYRPKEYFTQKISELNERIRNYNLAFNTNFELLDEL